MRDWIADLPEDDRDEVRKQYRKAKTFAKQVGVLGDWHPLGHLTLKPIKNLEEYFKYIRVCTSDSTWFRGEVRDFGNLVPKLYRGIDESRISEQQRKERRYFLEFQRRSRSLVPEVHPSDKWSCYFLIQHYGGPTRLLDWTQDAAIALFFAVGIDRDDTEDSIVTCMTPTSLLEFAFKDIGEEYTVGARILYPGDNPTQKWIANIALEDDSKIAELPASPIALLPPYLNPRISAQRSCFTLFGSRIDGFMQDGKQVICPCCGRKIFNKLVIDGKSKSNLRKELTRIGITSGAYTLD